MKTNVPQRAVAKAHLVPRCPSRPHLPSNRPRLRLTRERALPEAQKGTAVRGTAAKADLPTTGRSLEEELSDDSSDERWKDLQEKRFRNGWSALAKVGTRERSPWDLVGKASAEVDERRRVKRKKRRPQKKETTSGPPLLHDIGSCPKGAHDGYPQPDATSKPTVVNKCKAGKTIVRKSGIFWVKYGFT